MPLHADTETITRRLDALDHAGGRGGVDHHASRLVRRRLVVGAVHVELVGAGKGFAGQPRLGVTARSSIDPVDFGLPALLGDAIEIVIDSEFQRNP